MSQLNALIKRKNIQLLHVGKSKLQWDEETYRAVLYRITGVTSSTRCTVAQLDAVLEFMKTKGFLPVAKKNGRKPRVSRGRIRTLAKIEALLTDAGGPWNYAESMSKRMFNQQIIEWLTDAELTKLMQALIIDSRRRGYAHEQ